MHWLQGKNLNCWAQKEKKQLWKLYMQIKKSEIAKLKADMYASKHNKPKQSLLRQFSKELPNGKLCQNLA